MLLGTQARAGAGEMRMLVYLVWSRHCFTRGGRPMEEGEGVGTGEGLGEGTGEGVGVGDDEGCGD